MQPAVIRHNKTRLAPTPSGFLHPGNVLSFAITASLAQKVGTKILLRIDDLDRPRVERQYIQDIFDTLNFLEIPWDEGPLNVKDFEESYSQLRRMKIYTAALRQLADNERVFACTCSRKQLVQANSCNCREKRISLHTDNASWRFITRNDIKLKVKSYGGQEMSASLPPDMDNFIVRKKDGFPAYQLTSVIDDLFYGIGLVVRGNDLWPSTLAQLELASAIGDNNFCDVVFYHHPLLQETSGGKLSKSAGAASVKHLRESGKSPADVYTLIAGMLGINETMSNWEQLAQRVIGF